VGTVRALRDVKVGSKIAERVEKLLVDEGDPVKQGQVVCLLDTTDTKLQIQEAEARLEEAQAVLAKLKAGERLNTIRQLEAEVEERKATVQKLEQDSKRMRTLFAKGVVSDAQRDSVVADYNTAVARLHGAEAALALAREGTRKEEIAGAEADVALRQAELSLARQRVKDASILSPVTGYVVRKHVEEGEWTQIGGTVVDLIDTSLLRVHTMVTEKVIRQVREGQRVVMTFDAHPGKHFEGVVHRVIPKADEASRSFPVQINVHNGRQGVRAGMFARVGFVLDERQNVLQVPEDAIVLSRGLTLVFKALPMPAPQGAGGGPPGGAPGKGAPKPAAKGAAGAPPKAAAGGPPGGMPPMPGPIFLSARVVVRTGVRQEGMIEIREVVDGTLDADDLVVVTGNGNLRETQPMTVVSGLPGKQNAAPASPKSAPKTPADSPRQAKQ